MGQRLFLKWMVPTELPGPSIASVAVRMSTEENGVVMLTPRAVNYREFEAQVDMLIAELQKLKQQAKAKYGVSRAG